MLVKGPRERIPPTLSFPCLENGDSGWKPLTEHAEAQGGRVTKAFGANSILRRRKLRSGEGGCLCGF